MSVSVTDLSSRRECIATPCRQTQTHSREAFRAHSSLASLSPVNGNKSAAAHVRQAADTSTAVFESWTTLPPADSSQSRQSAGLWHVEHDTPPLSMQSRDTSADATQAVTSPRSAGSRPLTFGSTRFEHTQQHSMRPESTGAPELSSYDTHTVRIAPFPVSASSPIKPSAGRRPQGPRVLQRKSMSPQRKVLAARDLNTAYVRPDSATTTASADENDLTVLGGANRLVAKAASAEALDRATRMLEQLQRDNDALQAELLDVKAANQKLQRERDTAIVARDAATSAVETSSRAAAKFDVLQEELTAERETADDMADLVRFLGVQLKVYTSTLEGERDDLRRKLGLPGTLAQSS